MKYNTVAHFRVAFPGVLVACGWWGAGCVSTPRVVPGSPAAAEAPAARHAGGPQSDVTAGAAPEAAPRPAPAPAPAIPVRQSTRDAMEQVLIPSITFENAPIDAVIEELIRISREADPEGMGVNIILMPDRPRQPVAPEPQSLGPAPSVPRVTLALRRVTFYDLLRIVCMVADLDMRTQDDGFRLYPKGAAPNVMETRIYPVTPAMVPVTIVRD